jgi:excisionase family DNA binding protein
VLLLLPVVDIVAVALYRGPSNPERAAVQTTDHLLTVHEVAEIMRVSNMTVYRLIRAGELRAARVGRGYRIRERDVEAYLSREMAP